MVHLQEEWFAWLRFKTLMSANIKRATRTCNDSWAQWLHCLQHCQPLLACHNVYTEPSHYQQDNELEKRRNVVNKNAPTKTTNCKNNTCCQQECQSCERSEQAQITLEHNDSWAQWLFLWVENKKHKIKWAVAHCPLQEVDSFLCGQRKKKHPSGGALRGHMDERNVQTLPSQNSEASQAPNQIK